MTSLTNFADSQQATASPSMDECLAAAAHTYARWLLERNEQAVAA